MFGRQPMYVSICIYEALDFNGTICQPLGPAAAGLDKRVAS
jgi:hypothetical protein